MHCDFIVCQSMMTLRSKAVSSKNDPTSYEHDFSLLNTAQYQTALTVVYECYTH